MPPAPCLYPSFTTRDRGYIYIEVNASGSNTISDGLFSDNRQRQINAVDTVAVTAARLRLPEGVRLQMRADAYNVFNHPNFDQPIGTLTDGNFGRSVQMLANGLGGLSSLYQLGGPRSMQITAKLLF